MSEHAKAVKAALETSDTGMNNFLQLMEDVPGDFSKLIEALSPSTNVDILEHKVKGYRMLVRDFDIIDLGGHLARDIYSIIGKRCRLIFKGEGQNEAEALLTLYLIHRLKEGFNKGCQRAGLDPVDIEAYLEEVI